MGVMGGSLDNRSIVITRSPEQSGELAELLRAAGARTVDLPLIRILPPEDTGPLDRAIDRLAEHAMVVLASKNALDRFLERVRARGRDAELLRVRYACVGEKTRAALLRELPEADVIAPGVFRAEALAEEVARSLAVGVEGGVEGGVGGGVGGGSAPGKRRVLVPRAAEGREALLEELTGRGVEVEAVCAYRIGAAPPASEETTREVEAADAITFMSGKTLERFFEVVRPEARARAILEKLVVAVIGPVAAEAASKLGVRVDVVPPKATAEALVAALGERFRTEHAR